jgi:hypothetical protein
MGNFITCASQNIIRVIKLRRMRWGGQVARTGETRCANNIAVVKPEGKRPLRRPRRKGKDNIRMDLTEIVLTGCIWIRMGTNGGLL